MVLRIVSNFRMQATSASFFVPSQAAERLNAPRTDVFFISPQKGMRRFIRIFFQEFFLRRELKNGSTRRGSMRNPTTPEKEIHWSKADRET